MSNFFISFQSKDVSWTLLIHSQNLEILCDELQSLMYVSFGAQRNFKSQPIPRFTTNLLATRRASEDAICRPSRFHLFLYLYNGIYKVTFAWLLTYTGEMCSLDNMQYYT